MHGKLRTRQGEPVFGYKGNTLPCTHNVFARRTEVVIGGQTVEADLVLHCRKNLFLTTADNGEVEIDGETVTAASSTVLANDNRPWPRSGYEIEFCGRRYTIEVVEDITPASPDGKLKLVCIDASK